MMRESNRKQEVASGGGPAPEPGTAAVGSLASFYEAFIALRILRARRRPFLSVVGFISMLGVVLGVTALTVILSVSGGFQTTIRDRLLGFYPHLVVMRRDGDFRDYREVAAKIRSVSGVRGVSPATYDEMMAAHGNRRAGVVVKGVEPDTVAEVGGLAEALLDGLSLNVLREEPTLDLSSPGAVALSGALAGTAASVVFLGRDEPVVIRDDPTPPDVAATRLRLLHNVRGAPALSLRFAGARPHNTPSATPRSAGNYVDLFDHGTIWVELRSTDDDAALARATFELVPERAYTVIATGKAGEEGPDAPALHMVEDSYLPLEEAQAQVRLLDATPSSEVEIVSADGDLALGPAMGRATPYALRPGRLPALIVADKLRERLGVRVGDEVTLVSPLRGLGNRSLGPFGMAPTAGRFEVAGFFKVGYYEYDNRFVITSFAAAQRFLNRGDVPRWLEVRFSDSLEVEQYREAVRAAIDPFDLTTFAAHVASSAMIVREALSGALGSRAFKPPESVLELIGNQTTLLRTLRFQDLDFGHRERFRLIDWRETYRYLFSSLQLQKVVLALFFLIIVLVASFNVIGSQSMIVHEKVRDIAILRSMGATQAGIRRIFLLQGMVIGTIGTTVGLALGWGVTALISGIGFGLDPQVYYISELPVDPNVWEFAATGVAALLFTFFAGRYSADKAARQNPVEGLRRLD